MTRKLVRPRKEAASISLFPFMDVFLCIMGALILMFIIIAQTPGEVVVRAYASASTAIAAVSPSQRPALEAKISSLRANCDEANQDLSQRRRRLSALDDHVRELRGQLTESEKAAGQLDAASADDAETAALRAEHAQLESRIAVAKKEFVKTLTKPDQKSYAIIPFEGPNHTHRRPIYIECRNDCVVVQPEGIVLVEADFELPGKDNPLAATLKAAREYLHVKAARELEQSGEPYPLLLVRPDGIAAYHVARAAISGRDFDFGYEFIDADWKIEYQQPDPKMALAMNQAVNTARDRPMRLAQAAPSLVTQKERDAMREAGYFDENDRSTPARRRSNNGGGAGSSRSGSGTGAGGGVYDAAAASSDGQSGNGSAGGNGPGNGPGGGFGPGTTNGPGGPGGPYAQGNPYGQALAAAGGYGGPGGGNGTGVGGRYAGGYPGTTSPGYGSGDGSGNGQPGAGGQYPGGQYPNGGNGGGLAGQPGGGTGPGGMPGQTPGGTGAPGAPGTGGAGTGTGNGDGRYPGGTGGGGAPGGLASANGAAGSGSGVGFGGGGTGPGTNGFGYSVPTGVGGAGGTGYAGGTGSGNGPSFGPGNSGTAAGGGTSGTGGPYTPGGTAGAGGTGAGGTGQGGTGGSGSPDAGALAGGGMGSPFDPTTGMQNGAYGGASGSPYGTGGGGGPGGGPGSVYGGGGGSGGSGGAGGGAYGSPGPYGSAAGGNGGPAASGGNGGAGGGGSSNSSGGYAGGSAVAGGSSGGSGGNSTGSSGGTGGTTSGAGPANGNSDPSAMASSGGGSGGSPTMGMPGGAGGGGSPSMGSGSPGGMGVGMPNINLSPDAQTNLVTEAQSSSAGGDPPDNANTTKPGNFAGKRYAKPQPGGSSSGSDGSGGGDADGDPSQTSSTVSRDFGKQPKSGHSHARKHFAEQSRSLVSITRPIKLECYSDRLVLVSDDGDSANNKVIPVTGFARDAVDRLETDIHDRIGTWGMAGRGMQWHPIVVVHVAPDATERFTAVQRMLKADGLEVRDKNAPATKTTSP